MEEQLVNTYNRPCDFWFIFLSVNNKEVDTYGSVMFDDIV